MAFLWAAEAAFAALSLVLCRPLPSPVIWGDLGDTPLRASLSEDSARDPASGTRLLGLLLLAAFTLCGSEPAVVLEPGLFISASFFICPFRLTVFEFSTSIYLHTRSIANVVPANAGCNVIADMPDIAVAKILLVLVSYIESNKRDGAGADIVEIVPNCSKLIINIK